MSLANTYKKHVLESLLREYLKDGTIPTAEELENDLIAYQSGHPNLSMPRSKYTNFFVERGGHSSASQMNTIIDIASDDIAVVVKELYNIADKASKFHERWSFESKRLAAKAQKLRSRVNSLLLLANYSAGYFASVSDVFTDMNFVDTENTTTHVNVDEQSVTLNPGTAEAGTVKQIDTNELTDLDVSFYPLSKKAGTSVFDVNSNNNLAQAFKTTNTVWVAKIVSSVPGSMACELKACLSKSSSLEISKIAFDYTGPLSPKSTVTVMYSEDGYTWNIGPTNEATKPLGSNMVWTFPLTAMRWVKFIFYKDAHDNGLYEYLYSCRHIRFYGVTYYQDRGNIFISDALSATNSNGDLVKFNLAQLDVCENIPAKTDIKYYLSVSKDDVEWSSWSDILPSSREDIKYPKVLSFAGASWTTNAKEETYKLNSNLDANQLTTTFDSSINGRDIVPYRFKETSFAAVNTAILVSANDDQDVISNSISVWRNTRTKDFDNYPDTTKVRGVVRGWGKKEQFYSCYFEIVDSNGKYLNFGDRACVVDGKETTGIVKIPAGVHKFETLSDNWFDISDKYLAVIAEGNTITTEEALQSIDPLYPYNHKLIIEGFLYSAGFKGNLVYTGTDNSAEFYSVRSSLFDLENNLNDYKYFAVKGVGKNEEAATLCVLVRYDPNDSGYSNELFHTKWRSGESGSAAYKYVKLKAEFISDDILLTPALTSYRIKLGL